MRREVTGAHARTVARRLLELLESSRPLPVLRQQVRLEKDEVYELVAALRDAIPDDLPRASSLHAVLAAAEAVEAAAHHAMPLPLSDDVRLPRSRVDELLRGLRAAGAQVG